MVILSALTAFCLTITFPLLLSGAWVTASWATLACLFLWMGLRLDSKLLVSMAYLVYMLAFARLLSCDSGELLGPNLQPNLDGLLDRLISFGGFIASLAAGPLAPAPRPPRRHHTPRPRQRPRRPPWPSLGKPPPPCSGAPPRCSSSTFISRLTTSAPASTPPPPHPWSPPSGWRRCSGAPEPVLAQVGRVAGEPGCCSSFSAATCSSGIWGQKTWSTAATTRWEWRWRGCSTSSPPWRRWVWPPWPPPGARPSNPPRSLAPGRSSCCLST